MIEFFLDDMSKIENKNERIKNEYKKRFLIVSASFFGTALIFQIFDLSLGRVLAITFIISICVAVIFGIAYIVYNYYDEKSQRDEWSQ